MTLTLDSLHQRLQDLGARPVHRDAIIRAWLQAQPLDRGTRRQPGAHAFPLRLRQALPTLADELAQVLQRRSEHPAADGSRRWLLALRDEQLIESVLLLRDGLCISSQVGCAVGCRFCMTGRSGLLRQLSSLEMVAQVVLARQEKTIRKVVFMGMGEPAHNLDEVIASIELLGEFGDIAHKNLVLSTVGDERVFTRLPQMRVKPALALSLHTTRADLRAELLPRAPRIAPADLVAAAETYARQVAYPIQLQWTLLAGVNDGDDEIAALAHLLHGKYAILNLIPYNSLDSDGPTHADFRRPSSERIAAMVARLQGHGILTKVRQSAGQDVAGGCGQLRARAGQRLPLRAAPEACHAG